MISQKIRLLILLFLINLPYLQAQEVGVKIDFFGYADNREFSASYTTPKTIFGVLASPQVYMKLDSSHQLIAGIHYNQDFGKHPGDKNRFNTIAYYNYNHKSIDFSIGLIPRLEKLTAIPRLVLADTFFYDRPNIEGIHLALNKNNYKQQLYIDWLSKQSHTKKEQFIAGTSGRYQWGKMYFTNDALLYHNALTSNNSIDENVQDNFVLTASLGLDLSKKTILDSLTIDVGAVYGYDRLRTQYENSGYGFISNIHLLYKRFFIKNMIYIGDALNLPNGDPFYRRKYYDRLDLGWIPFKTKAIEGKFTASFHFRKGGMDNQQAFTLRYKFHQLLWKK